MSGPEITPLASPALSTPWVPLWPLSTPTPPGGWMGQWSPAVSYVKGDQVVHGMSYYSAVVASVGVAPTDPQNAMAPSWIKAGDLTAGGLVGWWPLDDTGANARDLSGNAQTMIYQNTGAITRSVAGPVAPSKCVEFNTTGSGHAFIGQNVLLNTLGPEPGWSISAWIYATQARPSNYVGIVVKGAGALTCGLMYSGHDVVNGVWGGFWNGGFYRTGADTALPLNTWRHYVITCGGLVAKLFRDGTEVKSNVVPANPSGRAESLFIGRDWDVQSGANSYFPGRIDDVRVYRQVLTPAEVAALYAAGPAPY